MIPIFSNPARYAHPTEPEDIEKRDRLQDALRGAMMSLDKRASAPAVVSRLPKRSKIMPVVLEVITETPGITTPEINDYLHEHGIECARSTLDASLQALIVDDKIEAHQKSRRKPRKFYLVTDE